MEKSAQQSKSDWWGGEERQTAADRCRALGRLTLHYTHPWLSQLLAHVMSCRAAIMNEHQVEGRTGHVPCRPPDIYHHSVHMDPSLPGRRLHICAGKARRSTACRGLVAEARGVWLGARL